MKAATLDAINRYRLAGLLGERESLRFTPAGTAMLNATVQHASSQDEAGSQRRVELEMPVVFAGDCAVRANRVPLGTMISMHGFLAQRSRKSRLIVFHVTEFELLGKD